VGVVGGGVGTVGVVGAEVVLEVGTEPEVELDPEEVELDPDPEPDPEVWKVAEITDRVAGDVPLIVYPH